MIKKYLAFAVVSMFCAACSNSSTSLEGDEDEEEYEEGYSSKKEDKKSSSSTTPFDTTIVENTSLPAPSGLTAVVRSDTSWELHWNYTRNDASLEDGFIITRLNIDASVWEQIDSAGADVHYYSLKGKDMGGYYYRVCAYNKKGRSAFSEEYYVEPISGDAGGDDFVLASPSGLTATPSPESDTVWTLSWTYKRSANIPEKGFRIQQLDMVKSEWAEIGKSGAEVTHYVLKGKSKAGFYYRVCAYDDKGTTECSEDFLLPKSTGEAPTNNKLASPSNLTVTSVGDYQWELSWDYTRVDDFPEKGFKIYQLIPGSSDKSAWTYVGATAEEVSHYILNGVNKAGAYYRVCAFDAKENASGYTKEIYISLPKEDVVQNATLAAPTNLVQYAVSEGVWELSWSYNRSKGAPEHGFVVQKLDMATSKWVDYVESGAEVTHIRLSDVANDPDHYYRVYAWDSVGVKKGSDGKETIVRGRSAYSNEIFIAKPAATEIENAVLASPSNLSYRILGTSSWELLWNYTASEKVPENGFIVEELVNGEWKTIGTSKASVKHFYLSGVDKSNQYYRVCAYIMDGKDTVRSEKYTAELLIPEVTVEEDAKLASPGGLTYRILGTASWELLWNYTASAKVPEKGFIVEELVNGEWKTIGTSKASVKHFNLNGEDKANQYYRVCAYTMNGKDTVRSENYTAELLIPEVSVEEDAKLASPGGLSFRVLSSSSWELLWNYTASTKVPADGFIIEELVNEEWKTIGTSRASVKHFNLNGVDKANQYYRVCAYTYDGKDTVRSANYTEELLIPEISAEEEAKLASPSSLSYRILGTSSWELLWNYTASAKVAEDGFIIEELVNGKWETVGTSMASVKHFYLSGVDKANQYYRVCAFSMDGTDTVRSEKYTEELLIPEVSVEEDAKLASPGGLSFRVLSTSSWELLWNYTASAKVPEKGFIVEELVNGEWKTIGTSKASVKHFTLNGADKANQYYRVCAYTMDGADTVRSENYTAELLIPEVIVEEDAKLSSPSNLSYRVLGATSWELLWDYTASDKVPEDGFIVEELVNGEWKTIGTSKTSVKHFNLNGADKAKQYYRVYAYVMDGKDTVRSAKCTAELLIPEVTVEENAKLASPGNLSYRVLGATSWELLWDYTASDKVSEDGFIVEELVNGEWKTIGTSKTSVKHFNLDGADKAKQYYRVFAYVMDGKDTVRSAKCTEELLIPEATAEEKAKLTSPSNLSYRVLGATSWELLWNYTASAKVPEKGFIVEELVNGEWKTIGTSKASVKHFTLNGADKADQYYRVCAYTMDGTDTVRSENYTAELLIPEVTAAEDAKLASPSDLSYRVLDVSSWELLWKYTASDKVSEDGFIIEELVNGKWETVGTSKASVMHFNLNGADKANQYYRVCAYAMDGADTVRSEKYTAELLLPNVVTEEEAKLAVPTDLKVLRLAPSVWQLEWTYTDAVDRPAEGFVLQKLDNSTNTWKEEIKLSKDSRVYIYTLPASTTAVLANVNDFFRITSYDSRGTSSVWSEKALVGTKVDYREDLIMTVPAIVPTVNADDDNLEWLITSDFPNKVVENSEWTESVKYEYRWVDAAASTIPKAIMTIPVDYTSFMETPTAVCNAYMQIRVKWTDTNGYFDVSEWSDPIGSKPGSDSNLVDKAKKCEVH